LHANAAKPLSQEGGKDTCQDAIRKDGKRFF